MDRYEYDSNHLWIQHRIRRQKQQRLIIAVSCFLLAGACAASAFLLQKKQGNSPTDATRTPIIIEVPSPGNTNIEDNSDSVIIVDSPAGQLLAEADIIAAGYDYDRAIELLQSSEFASEPSVTEAIASYEATRASLVKAKIGEVTHIFFHSIVMDNSKAFDGDSDMDGYNQVMTTASEFEKILQTMYDKGYVLVRMHDLAYETTDENGNSVMKPGTILLPEGKIPFVMSQDDVCYYPYMNGDGFATRMIVGEDGKPTCEMKIDEDTTLVGSYDLVPLLEDFIQEHPDFSYKGARAVIAFTGYEGILGYRTSDKYANSETYEQDRQEAARVAQCLKDNGWELASHSWGHLMMGEIEMDRFRTDTDKWEEQVDSLIGPIDIILYPFGNDINDWHPYTFENERFSYLYHAGFRYFCNVEGHNRRKRRTGTQAVRSLPCRRYF